MDRDRVEAALAALAAELRSPLTHPAVTVGKLFVRFRDSRPRDRAWTLVRGLLRPFIVRFWREPCSSIDVGRWDEHRRLRNATVTRLGRPPCDATVNLELARTKQMFKYGMTLGWLQVNPIEGAKRVKAISARETWLTAEQVERLLEAAHHDPFLYAWILVAVGTGMRMSEVLSLRWDRITSTGVTVLAARGTKTRKQHVVCLPRSALAGLARLPRHVASPYVFTNPQRGKKYHPCTIRRWFRFAVESIGLDAVVAEGDGKLLCHDARHTFASIADSRGASATAIRDALNHSSLKITERYLHRSRTESAQAMAMLMERRPAQKSATTSIVEVDRRSSTGARIVS